MDQLSGRRGRDSSYAVRSMAPLAAARACASDTMLRAASASLRIENAKPLPITVSRIVSHSASTSAMPRWRCACALTRWMEEHGVADIVMPARTVAASASQPRHPASGALARRDHERGPRRALDRRHVDANQQRQRMRVVPAIAPRRRVVGARVGIAAVVADLQFLDVIREHRALGIVELRHVESRSGPAPSARG